MNKNDDVSFFDELVALEETMKVQTNPLIENQIESDFGTQANANQVDCEEETLWEQWESLALEPMGFYMRGELIAGTRAIEILKSLKNGESVRYWDWLCEITEFANQFEGTLAKVRDVEYRLCYLFEHGLFHIEGSLDSVEEMKEAKVTLTAKGYLALPQEYFK